MPTFRGNLFLLAARISDVWFHTLTIINLPCHLVRRTSRLRYTIARDSKGLYFCKNILEKSCLSGGWTRLGGRMRGRIDSSERKESRKLEATSMNFRWTWLQRLRFARRSLRTRMYHRGCGKSDRYDADSDGGEKKKKCVKSARMLPDPAKISHSHETPTGLVLLASPF